MNMKIRTFSGEFQRKISFSDPIEEIPFKKRLSGEGSISVQIEEILTCLIESEYPYKDLFSAVRAIEDLIPEEKPPEWKPRIWYEIYPGKIVLGNREMIWNSSAAGGAMLLSNEYYGEE